MQHHKVPFDQTNSFSSLFLEYVNSSPSLKAFYDFEPSFEGLKEAVNTWQFDASKRPTLVKILEEQNQGSSEKVLQNIASLQKENTYTVTTGHQLNLMTGPLYFIYKIVSTIQLAEKLKQEMPDKHFVPVYWMASEDHDFQEINHFHLFGKKHTWLSAQQGAVGQFNLEGFEEVLNELPEEITLSRFYKESKTLSEATRKLVNHLFEDKGLVIIDADSAELKQLFYPTIKEEITNQYSFDLVEKTSSQLIEKGYKKQVNPREINLFYLGENSRERIVKEDNRLKVLNSQVDWSLEEGLDFFAKYPEKVSPNVILRPLYQQTILPNIAYLGGPGELAYWFQLKGLFHHYGQKVPVLLPRNFATIIPKTIWKKVQQLSLEVSDIFMWFDDLKKKVIDSQDEETISLQNEMKLFQDAFQQVESKVSELDKSLLAGVDGEKNKLLKSLGKLEKRLEKVEEQKFATQVQKVEVIKSKLFPEGGLQERHDNFLNFYLNHPDFIKDLFETFDPLKFEMNVLCYE